MTFTPPIDHMRFTLETLGGPAQLAATGAFADLSSDLVAAVLGEAGRFAADVLAPLNSQGDRARARMVNGQVVTAPGFKDAYRRFAADGWAGISFAAELGGQGLPRVLSFAVHELWSAANMAFSLCPMLSKGAAEGLIAHGTDDLKARFLPQLVSGAWTGTMNLTEPQAGSDLSAVKMRAEPQADGSYKLRGTKIFITWGEHDAADNIIHLVLARLPDAPAGTRGLSLFLVPRILENGTANDVKCLRLEEKLGIHASPTCVMAFGDNSGAVGYLVGQANKGLTGMFTLMNDARLSVGIQGLGIAERAYQQALAYAGERKQGRPFARRHDDTGMVPIIAHPDVRRMLATMKAKIEAMRLLTYANALAIDLAHTAPDEAARQAAQARADLLTPVSKAWCTDQGVDVASLGIQVHGGMGYIEETGAAQHLRDARIAPIYEGTNGIQAIDLVTRKLSLAGGAVVAAFLAEIGATVRSLKTSGKTGFAVMGQALEAAHAALSEATAFLQGKLGTAPDEALAGATPYLSLFGTVAGGHFLARGALLAAAGRFPASPAFHETRIALAHFYAANMLPQAAGLAAAAMAGMGDLAALDGAKLAL